MDYQITIQPSGHRYPGDGQETILEAALKHGYTLPYSCRDGVCGVCKGKIVEGRVDYGNYLGSTLSEAEKAAGMALFCCATPLSDLVIECREVTVASDIQIKTLPCRVQKMDRVAEDVMVLQLKLPSNERLQFLPGQYISILLKDQKPRSFSLANAPHDDEFIELHIRHIEGGVFSSRVFNEMKERDILRFRGPLGTFFLREDSDKPVVLVASGTGFAPIKAIIEHALHVGLRRAMHLYWGARKLSGLYMLDMARQWEVSGVKFNPVLSEPLPADNWQGRTGLVHQAVMEDFGDLSEFEVYACGAPAMIEAARNEFISMRKLPEGSFFSDMFTFAPKN